MNGHKNYFNSTCSVNRAVQKPLQNVMMLPFLILFFSQLCIHPGMSWFLHLLSPGIYKKVACIGQQYLLKGTVYWDEDNRDLMKLQWWQQRESQKTLNLMSKTTTLHVHHVFLYILCCPFTTTMWNDQILSWLENGNGSAINFTSSLWTRMRSPLFSSNLTFLLLSNRVTWYKGGKVLKDAKSIFQQSFHWRHHCQIVRSLIVLWSMPQNSFIITPGQHFKQLRE